MINVWSKCVLAYCILYPALLLRIILLCEYRKGGDGDDTEDTEFDDAVRASLYCSLAYQCCSQHTHFTDCFLEYTHTECFIETASRKCTQPHLYQELLLNLQNKPHRRWLADVLNFLKEGDSGCFHAIRWAFVAAQYWCKVSSPVMICSKKSSPRSLKWHLTELAHWKGNKFCSSFIQYENFSLKSCDCRKALCRLCE